MKRLAEKIYAVALEIIRLCFRWGILKKHRLPVPVVSVGNLTWGGTGKTPLVIHLARALQAQGRKVAVLTRGYGRDESKLMLKRLYPIPVVVGADRVAAGEQAIREHGADLLLLDDGYQQWRLDKDVEILTADSKAPFGNGRLIPGGTLRELPAAAARADLIVLKDSGSDPAAAKQAKARIRQFNQEAPVFVMRYEAERVWQWPSGKEIPLKSFRGQRICTLAGIADPQAFESAVKSLGAEPALRYRVRDHHAYSAGELIRLLDRCRRHRIGSVATTAKDAVRIPETFRSATGPGLGGVEFWVLEIKPRFEPDESELLHRIHSVLAG